MSFKDSPVLHHIACLDISLYEQRNSDNASISVFLSQRLILDCRAREGNPFSLFPLSALLLPIQVSDLLPSSFPVTEWNQTIYLKQDPDNISPLATALHSIRRVSRLWLWAEFGSRPNVPNDAMAVLSLFKLSSNMVWLFDQHFNKIKNKSIQKIFSQILSFLTFPTHYQFCPIWSKAFNTYINLSQG